MRILIPAPAPPAGPQRAVRHAVNPGSAPHPSSCVPGRAPRRVLSPEMPCSPRNPTVTKTELA